MGKANIASGTSTVTIVFISLSAGQYNLETDWAEAGAEVIPRRCPICVQDSIVEAVKQYLERESWVNFVERNEARAKAMGITEDDVPRLVEEVRREKHRERGH